MLIQLFADGKCIYIDNLCPLYIYMYPISYVCIGKIQALYWLGCCGKIANGLMVSPYFNMLANYSDTCQMPEPQIYLRMCHHEKLSFTKVTERPADGGTLNFKWFLLLVSVAKQ